MIKATPDDGCISLPDKPTIGQKAVTEIATKAQVIYPDHAGSRETYIREKTAERITALCAKVEELEGRLQRGNAFTGSQPAIDEG